MTAQSIIRRGESLKADRGVWDGHFQEVAELVFPNHPDFLGDLTVGQKKGLKTYDSTAIHSAEMLASGLHGRLTNPASEWFKLEFEDSNMNRTRRFSSWLQEVEKTMYKELRNSVSAFSTHAHEMYLEFVTFGTGVLFIGETADLDGVLYKSIPLSEAYIAESQDGIVDTLYRFPTFKVRNLVDKFGLDNVSKKIQKLYQDEKYDLDIHIIHAVEPKEGRWSSVYVEIETKQVLREGFFDSFPYAVPRFYKAAGETYGRSPVITALPTFKMLNEMQKTLIKAAQKVVDPPLLAPDDGYLNPVRTVPGGINYFRPGADKIEALNTQANIPIGLEMVQQAQEAIRLMFFVDQLSLPNKAERVTATEIMQRTEDSMRLLGPVAGRIQSEALEVVIDRTFKILLTQGKFPPTPEGLQGSDFKVSYTSPIARAQQQLEALSLQRVLEIMTPFASIDPQIMSRFDSEEVLKGVSEMFGLRPSFLKTEEAVEAEKQQAQQMQEMAQGAEIAKTGSEAALNLAQIQGVQGG